MKRKMQALGLLCGMALAPMMANAALVVDLRFADGSKSKTAAPGTYTVNIWAQVTGADAASANDGLLSAEGSLQSFQSSGGAIVPAAAGTSGVLGGATPIGLFTNVSPIGKPGTTQNLSADNVNDWGALSGTNALKFSSSDGTTFVQSSNAGGGNFNLINDGSLGAGVELLVGSFVVTVAVGDVNGSGTTFFQWVKGTSAVPTASNRREDNAGATSNVTYLQGLIPGNAVAFVVPEPGSIGLLSLGALAVGAIRRRKA